MTLQEKFEEIIDKYHYADHDSNVDAITAAHEIMILVKQERNEFAKGFAEWIRDEEYYNNGTVWFKHSNIEMPQYTIDQLLEQYIQSLTPKQ